MKRILHILPALATWIVYLLTLLAGFAAYIPPRVWALPQMLCLVLLPLVAFTLVGVIAWLIARNRVLAIAGITVLLLISPQILQAFPLGTKGKALPGHKSFTLMTYNVLGFGSLNQNNSGPYPASPTLGTILRENPDILVTQEAYANRESPKNSPERRAQFDSLYNRYPYRSGGLNFSIYTFSRYPMTTIDSGGKDHGQYFRYIASRIQLPQGGVTVLNVHLSSFELSDSDKSIFSSTAKGFKGMRASASTFRHSTYRKLAHAFLARAQAARKIAHVCKKLPEPIIVAGDFNDVPASYAYTTIRHAGLEDAYTDTNFGPVITYNAFHFLFHIDQVLYKGGLTPISVKRLKTGTSDHYPLFCTFQFE